METVLLVDTTVAEMWAAVKGAPPLALCSRVWRQQWRSTRLGPVSLSDPEKPLLMTIKGQIYDISLQW